MSEMIEKSAGEAVATPEMSLDVTPCHTGEATSITSEEAGESSRCNGLTDRHLVALDLVLGGHSDGKVAEAVGVTRRTIIRWRLEDADFAAELRRRRQRLCDDAVDRLRRLLAPSLDVVAEALKSGYDVHRLRAATSVLRIARVGTLLKVAAEKEGE